MNQNAGHYRITCRLILGRVGPRHPVVMELGPDGTYELSLGVATEHRDGMTAYECGCWEPSTDNPHLCSIHLAKPLLDPGNPPQ